MFKPKDDYQYDKKLLQKLKANDDLAFDTIYNKYWELIYSSAYKRLVNEEASRDIVQDIFLQLWLRREELEIDNLAAYLYTAVRNRVLKYMDKTRRFVPLPELLDQLLTAKDQADAFVLRKEFFVYYEALIDTLSTTQQEIFRMRFHEDLSTIEIADRLKIKRKTVQNQLGRSIAQLRQSIGLLLLLGFLKELW